MINIVMLAFMLFSGGITALATYIVFAAGKMEQVAIGVGFTAFAVAGAIYFAIQAVKDEGA